MWFGETPPPAATRALSMLATLPLWCLVSRGIGRVWAMDLWPDGRPLLSWPLGEKLPRNITLRVLHRGTSYEVHIVLPPRPGTVDSVEAAITLRPIYNPWRSRVWAVVLMPDKLGAGPIPLRAPWWLGLAR